MRRTLPLLLALMAIACGDDEVRKDPTPPDGCLEESFEVGDELGHPDPFGAKAAGDARASRIEASEVAQPAHGRQQIQDGDFVLINDKIAVVIEAGGLSDGYARFGGEILAIDKVGDDGKPMGLSNYVETLVGIGLTMPNPSSVAVLRDGSDGGEAVVRVIGRTEAIPFLAGSIGALFNSDVDVDVAYDYVLAPGAEKVVLRVGVANPTEADIDFGAIKSSSDELFGFFQTNHNQLATPELGFDAEGIASWVGFVSGEWNFAWRSLIGDLEFGLDISGFYLFNGPGHLATACSITTTDRVEVIAGGPYYDGLRQTIRRVDDAPAWREISGTVVDAGGTPIADAWVHVLDEDDLYVSRARSGDDGRYVVHAPPDEPAHLVAQSRGYLHAGTDVPASESDVSLQFEPHGLIHVTAESLADATPLPVRVQVIPSESLPSTPGHWGVPDEQSGRLHQSFVMNGDTTVAVPPGQHRVVVSRGYEWEIHDETISVVAGETVDVDGVLEHSVDTTGWMCADFHIHSFQSADSSDPVDYKVRGAIADGLDIPVSSEHEWIVDFGPVIESMGLSQWAYGMPSSELTTFQYGHFGVVPLLPQPGEYNNGAIDWIGKSPAETFQAVDDRSEAPALIINHPSGSGIGAYFSSVALDKDTGEPQNADLWSDNFDAIEVFNDSDFEANRNGSVAHWFALLNNGMRVSAVGNSDTHKLRSSPAGYPRTCFPFGHDDPTALSHVDVRNGIANGTGTVSGGLFMTVDGPGGEGPGETIAAGNHTFTVTIESPSWIDTEQLEVIVNGVTTSTETPLPLGTGSANRYVNQVTLNLSSGDWVLFHASGVSDLAPLHPGRTAFAVTNPIYVQ